MTALGLTRHRQLAPLASVRVSPLCLGTMTFGHAHASRLGKCEKSEAVKILDTFYDAGGNLIDTANGYHDGESEEWIGEWMTSRSNRDEIFLATKYTNRYKSPSEFGPGHTSNHFGNGLKSMRLSIDASLRRLQTTYVDLLYLHLWDWTASIPEVMYGLNDLITSGKVMYLGISDSPAWVVAKANQYARDHGLRPFAVYQGMWNVGMRDFEREIIPMVISEGMALCPYGTLGQGRFQTRERYIEMASDGFNHEGRRGMSNEHDKRIAGTLQDIAEARGGTDEMLNIALAYVRHKSPYVFPIVGGRKVEHLVAGLQALNVKLTHQEIDKIESAYQFEHGFPTNFLNAALFVPGAPDIMVTSPQDVKIIPHADIDWVLPTSPVV